MPTRWLGTGSYYKLFIFIKNADFGYRKSGGCELVECDVFKGFAYSERANFNRASALLCMLEQM